MSSRHDDTPDKKGLRPVSRIIQDTLALLGLQDRMQERGVLGQWPKIVGEEIAAHSQAVDIREGVLILEAEHGAWRQELTMLMPRIMEKFNELCGPGTVTEIQWRDRPRRGRQG